MAYDPANRGGAGGSNYTFSRTSSGIGNWNTGGAQTHTGSFQNGISPIGNVSTNRVGMPQSPRQAIPIPRPVMAPPIPQMAPPATAYPVPGTVTDVFGPNVRMDPGIIAQMIRSLNRNPVPAASTGSTFHKQPARGSFIGTPRDDRYGNDQFGNSFGGFGPRNNGGSGGGFGGGGGGGF